MFFVTKKKYDTLVAERNKLQREHESLWNLYNVTNMGYKELEKDNMSLREQNNRYRSEKVDKAPAKLSPTQTHKKERIVQSIAAVRRENGDYYTPASPVFIIGDTLGQSVMDKPLEGAGGTFGGGGASESWSDDSCSKSYGGSDSSSDSSSSSCSDSSSSSSSYSSTD